MEFDRENWAERKRAQREAAYGQIEAWLEELPMEPEYLQKYLEVQARFPRCGLGNAILIAAQRPETTEYHTFEEWKEKGVSIRKGEQGISLLVPGNTYTGKDGKTHTGYDVRKVFDISQTSADPGKEGHAGDKTADGPENQEGEMQQSAGVIPDLRLLVKALLMYPGVPVQVSPQQTGAAFTDGQVIIGKGLSEADAIQSITTALAHGEMDKGIENYQPGLALNVFYARCVSCIVCRHYGSPSEKETFQDMQSAFGPCNGNDVRNHLNTIRNTARSIIDRVEKALSRMENTRAEPDGRGAR